MRLTILSLSIALTLGLAGCGYTYTQTTQSVAPAKQADCAFDLLTTRPERPYLELGVLEAPGDGGNGAANAGRFKSMVSNDVCRAGGDAVLTEVNGFGKYVRGTVIKYTDAGAAPVAAAPPAAAPPAAAPPAAAPVKSSASVVAGSAEVRTAPFSVAPVVTTLAQGQKIAVGNAANGWRPATLSDGRTGYVQDAQIKVDASAP